MKAYLKLIRIKHYVKNLLIFTALVFSGQLLVSGKLRDCAIGFAAFCLVSSAIYVFNDIKDKDKDRLHPQKCKRPVASGEISVKNAVIVMFVCLILAGVCFAFIFNRQALILLTAYIALNIGYSLGLKNIPLVDVTILVAGFLIRVLFGAVITGIVVSNWLYLTVISLSFFMALGKRRNELKQFGSDNTRQVLKSYNASFLEKSMYMCLTMANTFYSLWAMSDADENVRNLKIFTVPVVFLITLKYCMNIENDSSDGDPTEVLFHDKVLLLLSLLYAVAMILILYRR